MESDDVITGGDSIGGLRRAVEVASGDFWIEARSRRSSKLRAATLFHAQGRARGTVIDCVMYRFDAQAGSPHSQGRSSPSVEVGAPPCGRRAAGSSSSGHSRAWPGGASCSLRSKKLKEQLSKEGLFESLAQAPLPPAPRVVGVVTSGAGAAFHDIPAYFQRGGLKLVLAPALVQGDAAAFEHRGGESICWSATPGSRRCIVRRGGGFRRRIWWRSR